MEDTPVAIPSGTEADPAPSIDELLAAAGNTRQQIAEMQEAATALVTELQRLFADAQPKLAEALEAATQALAAKTTITDNQTVIESKSEHIQRAMEHADKVQAEMASALTAATQQATLAEGEKAKAQSAAESASEQLAKTQAVKATVDADAVKVAEALRLAEESAAKAKGLAERSSEVEARVADYEKRLEELGAKSAEQLKKIDELLPSATTTGLAHAFDERRQTFIGPQARWQIGFVCSVVVLALLAAVGMFEVLFTKTIPTWDELGRFLIVRIPVAGALVWLALYTSNEAALAKQLEEDYGYKAAVATCFDGFKKQMSDVGKDVDPNSPLAKLLDNTLKMIAASPGRIYDKHKLTVSPLDELKPLIEGLKAATEAIKTVTKIG